MRGKVQLETVSSPLLRGNALGDPHRRDIPVYLPPSYGTVPGRRYPVIFYLCGFTAGGRTVLNFHPWKESIVERLDRLIEDGKAKECVLVAPDCLTAFGGSQYINSSATGPYEDHLVGELVAFIEDKFAVSRRPEGRALMGKSSGGYAALMLAMRHPDVFGHAVSHSGDMLFEACYGQDLLKFASGLSKFGGSAQRFVREFLASRKRDSFDHDAVNLVAMASCYSPNPKSPLGFDLPCDERTGETVPEVWKRWREKDPVVAAGRHKEALKRLHTLYFDCGRRDEFFLHLGARKLASTLKALGVRHMHEEHDFGHFDMSDRYEVSLQLLSRRLKP